MRLNSDEEFARQIQARLTPVQQQLQSSFLHLDQNKPFEEAVNFDARTNSTMSPHISSLPSSEFQFFNPSDLVCPHCSQQREPESTLCWRCFRPLSPVSLQTQNPFPTLTPINIQQQTYLEQERVMHLRAQQGEIERQKQSQLQQQQFHGIQNQLQQKMQQMQQRQSIQPSFFNQPGYQHPYPFRSMEQAMRQVETVNPALTWQSRTQQPPQLQINHTASFSGMAISSNLVNFGDCTPQSKPVQTNPVLPALSLHPISLNNGWPVQLKPIASQIIDAAGYLRYLPQSSNPSSVEIKELLSNIRPDEDIKLEDKDAIIPGLAKHMRLMKHQQVFSSSYCLIVDGIGLDAEDGR